MLSGKLDLIKYCSKCKRDKSLNSFGNRLAAKDGKQAWCQACMSERRQKWKEDNPERNKELAEKHKHTDKSKITRKNRKYERRQRLNNTPEGMRLTAKQWRMILTFYDNRCLCCGTDENITVDHIKPLALGGLNTASNIQPLCHRCNSLKRDKEIDYRNIILTF